MWVWGGGGQPGLARAPNIPLGSRFNGLVAALSRLWSAAARLLGIPIGCVIVQGHSRAGIDALGVSPDGQTIVSGAYDGGLRVRRADTGDTLHRLEQHIGTVFGVAISPNGRWLVSGAADATLCVWDLQTGALLRTLTGHAKAVSSVAVAPDGGTVVSGSYDDTIRVWDPETAALRRTLTGHNRQVNGVALTPDGGVRACGACAPFPEAKGGVCNFPHSFSAISQFSANFRNRGLLVPLLPTNRRQLPSNRRRVTLQPPAVTLQPPLVALQPCVSSVQKCCFLRHREVWSRHRNFPQFFAIGFDTPRPQSRPPPLPEGRRDFFCSETATSLRGGGVLLWLSAVFM